MKKQKSNKKIGLVKKTIAHLISKDNQYAVHGGDPTSRYVCEHWPTTAGN